MNNPVADFVAALTLGKAQEAGGLVVVPLLSEHEAKIPFLTVDDGLAQGIIELKEVHESGNVNKLKVVNKGGSGLFILDGEELVGAKQNRIANASFIVPASSEAVIDVSCVERGRWAYKSARFSSSGSVYAAKARRRKMEDVTHSLSMTGIHRSDQGRVWSSVDDYLSGSGTVSRTDSFADYHDRFKDRIDTLVATFEALPRQVGALVSVAGRIAGLDAFGNAATWKALSPKLVRSYAMDALTQTEDGTADEAASAAAEGLDPQGFLARLVDAPCEVFDSVGEGSDVRVRTRGVMASALVVCDEVLHLTAFPSLGLAV